MYSTLCTQRSQPDTDRMWHIISQNSSLEEREQEDTSKDSRWTLEYLSVLKYCLKQESFLAAAPKPVLVSLNSVRI